MKQNPSRVLQLFVAAFIFLGITQAGAANVPTHPYSAYRLPRESARTAYTRLRRTYPRYHRGLVSTSALSVAAPVAKIDLSNVPRWPSKEALMSAFVKIRDERFISDAGGRRLRRSTWLYPDDGCFARAALAVMRLDLRHTPGAAKVFVFGDLTVATENSPTGAVTWWYHVAPLVMLNGQPYVLDPAIYPKAPLPLKDWLKRQSGGSMTGIQVSVCDGSAYNPDSPCFTKADSLRNNLALQDQKMYLDMEVSRLQELGRNPDQELGENPPWLTAQRRQP